MFQYSVRLWTVLNRGPQQIYATSLGGEVKDMWH